MNELMNERMVSIVKSGLVPAPEVTLRLRIRQPFGLGQKVSPVQFVLRHFSFQRWNAEASWVGESLVLRWKYRRFMSVMNVPASLVDSAEQVNNRKIALGVAVDKSRGR